MGGLGEHVDGDDAFDAVATAGELAEIPRQGGRVARDVDDAFGDKAKEFGDGFGGAGAGRVEEDNGPIAGIQAGEVSGDVGGDKFGGERQAGGVFLGGGDGGGVGFDAENLGSGAGQGEGEHADAAIEVQGAGTFSYLGELKGEFDKFGRDGGVNLEESFATGAKR